MGQLKGVTIRLEDGKVLAVGYRWVLVSLHIQRNFLLTSKVVLSNSRVATTLALRVC